MAVRVLGVAAICGFLPGALSRYLWIRPEMTRAGLKTLSQGGMLSLAVQVTGLTIGFIGIANAKTAGEQDARFPITYTIGMIASAAALVALTGRLNFTFTPKETITTAALSWASIIGLIKIIP